MVIGTNTAFIPFFILGYDGMPRWLATYPAGAGFTTLNLISSIGAGIIGVAMCVFIWNLYGSARRAVPAGPDPWQGQTLEWATSSPPPRFNFNLEYPVISVRSYAPLLDRRERQAGPPRQSAAEQPEDDRAEEEDG
jgi:cytochrome c oxidase subunit 1